MIPHVAKQQIAAAIETFCGSLDPEERSPEVLAGVAGGIVEGVLLGAEIPEAARSPMWRECMEALGHNPDDGAAQRGRLAAHVAVTCHLAAASSPPS